MSAAAGAGIYFEERRGLLTSLWLLLQAQVGGDALRQRSLGWGWMIGGWARKSWRPQTLQQVAMCGMHDVHHGRKHPPFMTHAAHANDTC